MGSHAVKTLAALMLATAAVMAQRPATPLQKRSTPKLTSPHASTGADQFVEVSAQAGIRFTLASGGLDKRYIIEAKGGGGIAWKPSPGELVILCQSVRKMTRGERMEKDSSVSSALGWT